MVAKQIIAAYYGKPPEHSYYVGCSTGGREAMLMSQRYPLYFDGIVVGSPAMRTGHSNLATRTVTVALELDRAEGCERPAGPRLSDSEKKAFIAKLLDACDARDGAAGRDDLRRGGLHVPACGSPMPGREGGRVSVAGASGRH